jgi:hypothetical protein
MRGLLVAALAALAVAVTPALANAAPPDLTIGSGGFVFGPQEAHVDFQVSAHSYDGADPRGQFSLDQNDPSGGVDTFKVHGEVTCHLVIGNSAVVGGVLDEPLFEEFPFVLIFVRDGDPVDQPDSVVGLIFTTPRPCVSVVSPVPIVPVTRGNFVVEDR